MVEGKKRTIFAVLNHEAGRGPARLERLVWDQEIGFESCRPDYKSRSHGERFFLCRENESLLSGERRKVLPALMHKNRNLVKLKPSFTTSVKTGEHGFMVDSEPHR